METKAKDESGKNVIRSPEERLILTKAEILGMVRVSTYLEKKAEEESSETNVVTDVEACDWRIEDTTDPQKPCVLVPHDPIIYRDEQTKYVIANDSERDVFFVVLSKGLFKETDGVAPKILSKSTLTLHLCNPVESAEFKYRIAPMKLEGEAADEGGGVEGPDDGTVFVLPPP